MKLVRVEGCMNDSLEIDGKELCDYNFNEQKEILHKLIDSVDGCTLFFIISSIVEMNGEYEDLGRCDTCGDNVERYELTI
jgi:hypothetical protein